MATRDQVNAARSRGGKPSDANRVAGRTAAMDVYDNPQSKGQATASDGSIVERGPDGAVYRYVPKYGYTTIERDGNISAPMRGNQLPGGVNKYIDKVLDMSGMNDSKSSSAGVPDDLANVPTPTPRPDNQYAELPQEGPVPGARPDMDAAVANSGAATFGEALLGLLGGGAIGGAAKYALDKIRGASSNPVDATIAAVDGDGADAETPNDMRSEAAMIEEEKRKALPAPQQKLPAPSPVDETISAVDGEPPAEALPAPPKQLTDADAPYSPRNPAPPVSGLLTDADAPYSARNPASTPAPAPNRTDVIKQIIGKSPQEAAAILRQSGISLNDLSPDEIRVLAESSNAIRSAGRQSAADAVSGGVRAATRGAAR